jgi:hypothetical protein
MTTRPSGRRRAVEAKASVANATPARGDEHGELVPAIAMRPPLELFQIVVECASEAEQRAWYERLAAAGLRVRVMVL